MAKFKIFFCQGACQGAFATPGKSLHTADQATALPQIHQLLLVNSRAVYFFSDLRRHIALQSQIVLSTGAGDFTLLYRAPQTLPKLSHYLRCIFDYEKKLMSLFFPATVTENCDCYIILYSEWMQATFHACAGYFHRCQTLPTIPGVSVTT